MRRRFHRFRMPSLIFRPAGLKVSSLLSSIRGRRQVLGLTKIVDLGSARSRCRHSCPTRSPTSLLGNLLERRAMLALLLSRPYGNGHASDRLARQLVAKRMTVISQDHYLAELRGAFMISAEGHTLPFTADRKRRPEYCQSLTDRKGRSAEQCHFPPVTGRHDLGNLAASRLSPPLAWDYR
jgi:hypothetical protein